MSQIPPADFFDKKASRAYDEKAGKIAAINDNLHLLIRLVLGDLGPHSRVLCVGVGTGNEILALAEIFAGWTFTGIDPSASMLDVCREKLNKHGLASRCELVHGHLSELPAGEEYDAVLCLLVTHFIKDHSERGAMFAGMYKRLKPGGYMINADISYDMQSEQANDIMEKWKALHRRSGASEAQANTIPQTLRDHVSVMPPSFIEGLIRQGGFKRPVLFFQSLLIHAWYSRKT